MFNLKQRTSEETIDLAIAQAVQNLNLDDPTGLDDRIKNVTKLIKLKNLNRSKRVNPDTLVIAGANLLGIILIVGHEYTGVVTSKALALVLKPHA